MKLERKFQTRWSHGRREDFLQELSNSGFSRGSQKRLSKGPKMAKLHLSHSKLRKQTILL